MTVRLRDVKAALEPEEPNYKEAAKMGAEALPHLKRIIESDNVELASKAASLAGMIAHEGSADVLMSAAESQDVRVRVAAAHAASKLEESDRNELLEMLIDDADAGVQHAALKSIPAQPSRHLRSKITQMLADESFAAKYESTLSRVAERIGESMPASGSPTSEPSTHAPKLSDMPPMPQGGGEYDASSSMNTPGQSDQPQLRDMPGFGAGASGTLTNPMASPASPMTNPSMHPMMLPTTLPGANDSHLMPGEPSPQLAPGTYMPGTDSNAGSTAGSTALPLDSPFAPRDKGEYYEEAAPLIHKLSANIICETDRRGFAMPDNKSIAELVVDASEGFVPLWDKNQVLRWRFNPQSMAYFRNIPAAKNALRSLFARAVAMWGNSAPISFTEQEDAWDFEIVMRRSDSCSGGGCVLASAFFPDAGRQQLRIYPKMFTQDPVAQVETLVHEIGHIFGLRHFFAKVEETRWRSEIFGTHSPFSIMNYGNLSHLTEADKSDLKKLYSLVWSGELTDINGTAIRLFKPYHVSGNPL